MIIERSSKCHLYKHITTTFCIQNYLTKCLPVHLRKAITKMRCSSHKLMIEKGRYLNLERNQRVCSMGHLNDIEDEFHFILRCPAYNDLRKNTSNKDIVIDCLYSNYFNSLTQERYSYSYVTFFILLESSIYIICNYHVYLYYLSAIYLTPF